ncbi:prenyl cysteine carboxyl methyltransferase ste14 [Niveomyces insectorum RCEF 264]|uniref:Protein-S-isoprenylcysteine O-methyltransferase n=1 Tax=Niveomyces insectorum RCEF 264 TaxID=1081102 RepID=A0A167RHI7_9HYPO|nr:prenyl cysteine carboxyl methyltransferase ste14 [Niveomyces insectorum RCEF 264]
MDDSTSVDVGNGSATRRRPSSGSTSSSSSSSFSFQPPRNGSFAASTYPLPPDAASYPGQERSLAGIAGRAFCLGIALATGVLLAASLALLPLWVRLAPRVDDNAARSAVVDVVAPLWRLPCFLATLAAFHFLEFWATATYNTPAASVDAFLLTSNWPAYAIAHTAAGAECLLRYTLFRGDGAAVLPVPLSWWPRQTPPPPLLLLQMVVGWTLVLGGQAVRTAAMVQAGRSFNHTVQRRRATGHALVTRGVYGRLRHPSYFGFFWWALGTQLVLGNAVCLVVYAVVLWRFFAARIRHEEALLVRFFGADYVAYRARVGTKIPFIS